MARIRSVKPEFWTDEKAVEMSPLARLLFIGLWNFADDEGRMVYSPKRIKMQILPADSADISELLGEIRGKSLIQVYAVDGIEYLQVTNFTKHQKIDKRTASRLPSPPNSPESPPIPTTDQGRDQGREGIKERKGNSKGTGSAFAAPSWIPEDSWKAFEQMRSKARKPMTDRARELIVKELETLQGKGFDPVLVLDQSIRNNWQDVFPLKDKGGATQSLSSFMEERDKRRVSI